MRNRDLTVALLVVGVLAAACGDGGDTSTVSPGSTATSPGSTASPASGGAAGPLMGLFRLDGGECAEAGVTSGSYFRMVQSGGDASGPFVPNNDSSCGDATYTPLLPGSDGGLQTGGHQPAPEPAFDDAGNALAGAVTRPATWFAVDFALASNPTDPQTGTAVEPPAVTHDGGGALSGDLRALAAAWNGQHFNQGSPKPDGTMPGNTTAVTGTYDPATGAFTLEWASQIVGGPFDRFTGVWHLEGTFQAAG